MRDVFMTPLFCPFKADFDDVNRLFDVGAIFWIFLSEAHCRFTPSMYSRILTVPVIFILFNRL